MTITIPKTRKNWRALLLLIVAFAVFASNAEAQSRGSTEGRKEQTRKPAPKKATPKKSTSSQRSSSSSRTSSRQSSRSGGSGGEASKGSTQSGRSTQSRGSSKSTANAQSRSGSKSTANTESRGASQRTQSTQNSRGSQRTGNAQSNRSSSQNARSAQSSRNAGSSRGSSASSGSRTRQSGGNTTSRGDATRIGDEKTGNENATTSRGDTRRSGNTSATRQQSARGNASTARGATSTASRGTVGDREAASRRSGNERGAQQNSRGANASERGRRDNGGHTRIQPVPYNARYKTAARRYHNKRYVYRPHHQRNYYWRPPVYHHRPHVQVNVVWPWQNRYHRQWRPHYQYRQVVYVEVGWGGNRRQARVDVRTNYHQQVKYADHRKAVVDIWLDEIEVYQEGYYVGRVNRIPDHLSHIEATIYRNGDVVFDRDVFIVGDKRSGFEMISTRQYDGYVLDHYRRGDDMEVGKLNFRRKRVDSRRYSRLFDPYNFRGYAPISLLPEDRNLVADFGYESLSYGYYDDQNDPYYGGGYDDDYYDYDEYGNVYQYDRPDVYGYDSSYSLKPTNRLSVQAIAETKKPLTGRTSNQYKTKQGIAIKYERESELQRIR